MAASSVGTDDDTWALAFKLAQERESNLMLAYEEYLFSLQGDNAASGDMSIPEIIQSIVKRTIEEEEKKNWRVLLFGADFEVRIQVQRLTKFLLWSESIVKAAMSSQPYAALAWSGVSLLLPLITRNMKQKVAMLKGFNLIGDIQMYWRIWEETCLLSLNKSSYEQYLAKLYSVIIEYQARVLCHLSRRQLSREWNDIINPEEWDKKIQEIRRLDEECRNTLHVVNADQIERDWREQLIEMQESRGFLGKTHNTLLESGAEIQENYEDQRERALLQTLSSDYEGHKDLIPRKMEGTFEWFFADERFRNWRNSNVSSLLFVSADPGWGKSVLSRSLIDERRLSTNATTSIVCHFFFKDGDDSRMHPHNALSAILHQLFTHDPTGSLITQALPRYKNFGEALTHKFSELWKILLRCASLLNSGEIICVIDGLDECHVDSRWIFIDELKEFYRHPQGSSSKLKFLITSRPFGDIDIHFEKLSGATSYLRFDGDDKSAEISHDVDSIINFRVNEITQNFTENDRRLIADRLESMEHRTYLWLYFTLDIIKRITSQYGKGLDVDAVLSSLSSSLSEAYENILSRTATRPLTLAEANFALTLATAEPEHRFESHAILQDELWSLNNVKDDLINLCGLFIRVDDGKLYFIHPTAREFLVHPQRQGEWQGRFHDMSKSHSIMSSEAVEASSSRKDALALCCAANVWISIIYLSARTDEWKNWTSLDLASKFGLDQIVQMMLEAGADVDTQGSFGTPLQIAAYRGHGEIVQMLLDNGASMSLHAYRTNTALCGASDQGHVEIVKMLLDSGADVNMRGKGEWGYSGTALQAAANYSHEEIVQILLNHGADVNVRGGLWGTALQAASKNNHTEVVRMLSGRGAVINT
ncbi:ankyrin repeats (3 copies) domain-containing protein [Trichoderma breve]|uniref:Ankyrin repeats (3 copies) domain-containing protein n=1 Tax=Trichoderma breve TaxID=2034170 RepID=A0A9W9EBT6_9HYPO|nr:ankyrin repeats (3 copies) domain-containing protein [Trichoderma breve]KAJ4863764.1 ankyrin repeats (3 copies) domain-containing protein [Trichoderma breve]